MSFEDIPYNTTISCKIEHCSFDCLDEVAINTIFKDGRVFSHFIEKWLAEKYPLVHISGCKSYDFTHKMDSSILFDQKTFTKGGCKFYPSNMIGVGRSFNKEIFEEKANGLVYIIVSNIDFPKIKIKFMRGSDLLLRYPTGIIPLNKFSEFFD
jgi:hypothetical protein